MKSILPMSYSAQKESHAYPVDSEEPNCSVAGGGATDLPENAGRVPSMVCRRGGVSGLPRSVSGPTGADAHVVGTGGRSSSLGAVSGSARPIRPR